MPRLTPHFELTKCPHCSVANPVLHQVAQFETRDHSASILRRWRCYACRTCGNVVTASASNYDLDAQQYFPQSTEVQESIPERPRVFIQQAIDSLHAPAGAVMLAASAVDSMLKLKGYKDGSLYARIEQAVNDHLITNDMATWAHEVRLDANDQRHADEQATFPTQDDANRCVDFAIALAQFLFVLPARVQRGIADAAKE